MCSLSDDNYYVNRSMCRLALPHLSVRIQQTASRTLWWVGGADDEVQQFFISIEKTLTMESSNFISALYFLLAAHYIFNMSYHQKAKDILSLLQVKVANLSALPSHKWGAVVGGAHVVSMTREYESENLSSTEDYACTCTPNRI